MDGSPPTDQFSAFRCPKCGSDSTGKFSALHEGGTSHVSSSSSHVAVAFTGGGRLTPVLGGSSTSGIQQTEIAKKTAPPEERSVFGMGCFLGSLLVVGPILALIAAYLGAVVGFVIFGERGGAALGPLVLLTAFGAYALACWKAWQKGKADKRWNAETLPRLREEWSRKWLCMRCGEPFMPDATAAPVDQPNAAGV